MDVMLHFHEKFNGMIYMCAPARVQIRPNEEPEYDVTIDKGLHILTSYFFQGVKIGK